VTDPDEKTTAAEPESTAVEEIPAAPAVEAEAVEAEPAAEVPASSGGWLRVVAFGVLPVLAVLLAIGVGWLKWTDQRALEISTAREQAMQVAKDSTIALLSYNPDTVDKQLGEARSLLTGEFKDSYTSLTNEVVIPGAKEKKISAVATVPKAASVSTDPDRAVVLVFVNQTVVVGDTQPSATLSSVRVTLDKVDGTWLISKFDPV
jgi:Mce-associated membrane protein